MRKIGIYGGTFDPVHHGHLILAREAQEKLQLEKVIFVPARISPNRQSPVASGELRLAMLRAAIDGEKRFTVDDCELRRPPPSYTIDTVEEIGKQEDEAELYCLIGQDNMAELATWHRFRELEKLVRIVALDRTGSESKHDYPVVQRKIDISATEIRNRVASGQSIRYLVPEAVGVIIDREKLYRENKR